MTSLRAAALPILLAFGCAPASPPESPVVLIGAAGPAAPELQVAVSPRTPSPSAPLPFAVGQIWTGTYLCAQGETNLRLHVVAAARNEVRAIFSFVHLPSRAAGEYVLAGRYDPGERTLVLAPEWWINQPQDYIMVGMSGRLSPNGRRWEGAITHSSCRAFSVALGG